LKEVRITCDNCEKEMNTIEEMRVHCQITEPVEQNARLGLPMLEKDRQKYHNYYKAYAKLSRQEIEEVEI